MKEHNWPIAPADKIKGDITHGAFANPMLKSVLQRFGKTAFARSSACMEFEAFLNRVRPLDSTEMTCVEIGTFYGITAVVLSQYFKRVICISLDVPGARDQKFEIVKHLGIENIRFFDVSNNADKRVLLDQLDFDFCYSDGDHANDAAADFEMVSFMW